MAIGFNSGSNTVANLPQLLTQFRYTRFRL